MDYGRWAFDNKSLVWFLVAVLLGGGLFSAYNMSKLEDPEIKVKVAMVVATRPGASAFEMELEVTDPLEKAIRTIDDVKYIQSWSRNDVAILHVELHSTTKDYNLEQCWDILRRRVNDAASTLPDGVSVKVQDDFNLVYGIFYALIGDGYSERELSDYANLIRRELTNIDGVGRVTVYGEKKNVINIVLLPAKMATLGVSPTEVVATLKGHNSIFYAGYYGNGDNRVRVTVADRFKTIEQIGQMIIQGHEDDQLRLIDIANIETGIQEPVRNKLKHNGEEALGIAVAAASGTDITKVGAAVEKRLAELSKSHLPAGVAYNKVFYQPERVKDALSSFFVNLIESIAIVVFILMLTMGFRSGMIIGLTLLTIVVGSFLLLGIFDGSMQRVSLGTFILAMGMLVDNAIVIIDGILVDFRMGKPRKEALTSIGQKTAMPLLGATLIAILAFLPIFLSPDTAGVYIRDLFIVMTVSLLLSWILALTHVPLMADLWLKKPKNKENAQLYSGGVYRLLRSMLTFGLRHRWAMILCGIMLIAGSVIGYGYIKQGFFPDMTYDQLYIEYKLPENSNYTKVERDLMEIEAYLKSRKEVTDITASIGGTPARYNLVRSIATPSLSYGELIVSFTSAKILDENIEDIQDYLSTNFPDAYVKVKKYNIMYKKYPIEVQVIGPDPAVLNRLSEQIKNIMEQSPEACLITTDWEDKVPVYFVDYKQNLARSAGLNREDVSLSLLTATDSIPIGNFYEGGNENTIFLKCEEEDGHPIDNLENVPIFSIIPNISSLLTDEMLLKVKSGTITREEVIEKLIRSVPLGELGKGVKIKWEYPVIPRYNGQRAQTIMCSPSYGVETEAAQKIIEDKIEELELPEGYTLRWGGEKEASEQTLHYLFKNYPLCIVLIIAVLILLFKDYRKPMVILCCVPLLAVGIVGAMLISGKVFNFCAIVGALGLVGMLIKNCIVLMDEINAQLESGTEAHTALIESSCSRLRAVMMASLTTILGMIPLLSDDLFGSMAATIMGGLLFSTLATLIYLPIFYALFFKIKIKR
ncbi:MAG: efflux RND transporter permease subunit [Bacteroidaceae bacterium]|nr:efflux RND transporter permease subunit [Bacteroidaceae bacterium]